MASREDRYHEETVKLVKEKSGLVLSPYSLLEIDLIIRSGSLEINAEAFYESLNDLLEYYGIEVIKPSPLHLVRAWKLRKRYRMTYFDSLHASVALIEGIPILSYDNIYSGVKG